MHCENTKSENVDGRLDYIVRQIFESGSCEMNNIVIVLLKLPIL